MIKNNIFLQNEPYIVRDGYFHVFNNCLPVAPQCMLLNEAQKVVVYREHDNFNVKYKPFFPDDTMSILVVGDGGDTEFWNLLRLASLLNDTKGDIIFTGNEATLNQLSGYVNSHIQLRDLWNGGSFSLDVHFVIGYGPGMLFFIKQDIPVMIAGPLGLGGFVTPHNFADLEKNGFNGRPGGRMWELLPYSLYTEECSILRSWSKEISLEISELAAATTFVAASGAEKYLDGLSAHRLKIYDEDERWYLIPVLCSNITLGKSGSVFYASRKIINDTLAMFEEITFFTHLDQCRNFREIMDLMELDASDFWDFVYSLVKQHIITY